MSSGDVADFVGPVYFTQHFLFIYTLFIPLLYGEEQNEQNVVLFSILSEKDICTRCEQVLTGNRK